MTVYISSLPLPRHFEHHGEAIQERQKRERHWEIKRSQLTFHANKTSKQLIESVAPNDYHSAKIKLLTVSPEDSGGLQMTKPCFIFASVCGHTF